MMPFDNIFQKIYYFQISDHDSGNDEPEFLLRGAAAIVDLEKQLSRGDESEQEQENLDDQHALVNFFFQNNLKKFKKNPSKYLKIFRILGAHL